MIADLLPDLGRKTYIMGILNLTPDSFSGDGLYQAEQPLAAALSQARSFIAGGAHILDLGAESTRPGAESVSADEELARLLPAVELIHSQLPEALISVDTYKATVAEACQRAGARIINDIWGLRADPAMAALAAAADAGIVLMHNRRSAPQHTEITALGGRYVDLPAGDIVQEVVSGLNASVEIALAAGIPAGQIILDPGIGFGKTTEQNLQLLRRLDEIRAIGYPLLLGVSRKSFIGYILNLPPDERLEGSLAANAYGILHGADIVRVHDVSATARLAKMLDAIRQV